MLPIIPPQIFFKNRYFRTDTIYHEKLKPLLEPQYRGKIVAIEVESGDYFVDASVVKAGLQAKAKYPDKVFHFMRVGYRAVHKRR